MPRPWCYYSERRRICKEVKLPIFAQKFRENLQCENICPFFRSIIVEFAQVTRGHPAGLKLFLQKRLTNAARHAIMQRTMKQNVPRSHPAAAARRVDSKTPPGVGSVVRNCFARFFILPALPERRCLLLALEKIC